MNKMKKLCVLLLCLGVVGGTAACDMSMLGGMLGGSSVESGVESTEGESSSTDNTETSEIPDGSDMQDAWEDATKEENFNNVTFAYSVVFKGETEVNTGTAYLDGDKAACIEGDGDLELMDKEETEALRNVYVKTVLAVLDNFTSFTYDFVTNTFVSTAEIVYTVNVMGMEAKITANGVRVWFDGDGNVSAISCDMKHEFREDGVNKALEMRTEFTFTDYGKTVVDIGNSGQNPDGGEEVLTKAQWDAAFENTYATSNVTMNVWREDEYLDPNHEPYSMEYTNKYDYDKLENIQTFLNQTAYYAKEGEKVFAYNKKDGGWTKEEVSYEVGFSLEAAREIFSPVQVQYDAFTYDETRGCYVAKDFTLINPSNREEAYSEFRVRIVDGYIVEFGGDGIMMKDGEVYGTAHVMYSFSDYGTTKVELPKIEDAELTDEEAWHAAFEATYAYESATMKVGGKHTFDDGKEEMQDITYKAAPNVLMLVQTNGYTNYYSREGEKSYIYSMSNGEWEKRDYSGEAPVGSAILKMNLTPFEELYEHFTYDEKTGVYSAENVLTKRNGLNMMLYELRVYIVEGIVTKVESVSDIVSSKDGVIGRSYTIIDVMDLGGTEVELPKIEEAEMTDEEAWHAAFEKTLAVDNFSISLESYADYADPEHQDSMVFYTQKITQNTFESVQSFLHQTVYYEKNEEGSLEYTLKNGEWVTKQYGPERVQYTSESLVANVKPYEAFYAQMTYDKYTGWYVVENVTLAINDTEVYCYKLSVRIDNGYVVGIEVDQMIKNGNGEDAGRAYVKMTLFDFNTTVVKLPTAPTDKQVTENEWVSALNTAVNTNNVTAGMIYTFEYTDGQENEFTFSKMKLKENATYQWGSNSGRPYQQYYAKVDGVDYDYTITDGEWSKSELGQEVTYTNYRMESVFDPMLSLYENFTYDASKGLYTCAEIMLDAGNGRMQAIYNVQIGFEDGKVTYFYYEMDLTDSDGVKNGVAKIHVTLGDYGTTDFELPNV
ncbi:MAG: hypothetical protein IKA57_07320 [Clostridia bacterium]|nr:hypothetical protein [Clostridia bacterium]